MGFLKKLWKATKKIAPIALTAASFTPAGRGAGILAKGAGFLGKVGKVTGALGKAGRFLGSAAIGGVGFGVGEKVASGVFTGGPTGGAPAGFMGALRRIGPVAGVGAIGGAAGAGLTAMLTPDGQTVLVRRRRRRRGLSASDIKAARRVSSFMRSLGCSCPKRFSRRGRRRGKVC